MLELRTLGTADLRVRGGAELRALVQQPKRFALLTYLTLGVSGRYVRRDTLLGLFWPELDLEHARGALRRSLYFLRKSLGDEVIEGRGEEEVGLLPGALWCDAVAFREAERAGDPAGALALYQGDLLPGYYVAGAPEVEDWLDRERRRLRESGFHAARSLARAARDPSEAARWARRALELDENDPEMRALQSASLRGGAIVAAPAAALPAHDPHLLAIQPFMVRGSPGMEFLSEGMVDLLATKLDGAGELRVLEPRLVLAGAGGSAGLLVEGTILEVAGRIEATAALREAGGLVRARVEGRAEDESGLFEMVDQMALGLLAGLLTDAPGELSRLAARTTESLPALKAWLAGERNFRLARYQESVNDFRRATDLDPSFALAWHRLAGALAASALIEPARQASQRAHRARERLSEHDRQLLEAQHAWIGGQSGEAERRYAAIVTNWPESAEGWFLLGDVQFHSNPYRGKSIVQSREAFERTLALDPSHQGAMVQLARLAALQGRRDELAALVRTALKASSASDQALGLQALAAFSDPGAAATQSALIGELVSARGLTIARAVTDVALYAGNPDGAERLARELFAAARSEEFRGFGFVALAHLDLSRGRTALGFDRLREAALLEPTWSLTTRGLFATMDFLPVPEEVRTAVQRELSEWEPESSRPLFSIPLAFHNAINPHLRRFLLGLLSIRLGQADRAAEEAEAMAELPVPEGTTALLQHLGRTLHAEILEARGDSEGALAVLEQGQLDVWFQYAVASPFFAGTFERYLRARLLESVGRIPEAMRWWGAIAERSPFELPYLAPALRRQAALWTRLGDPERAAELQRRERVLWGDGPAW